MKHVKGYRVQENALLIVEQPGGTYVASSGYFDFIQLSRTGIIKRALLNLSRQLSFSLTELAQVVHLSERTLQRYDDDARLSADSSERAISTLR